jgi:hypothetical protein
VKIFLKENHTQKNNSGFGGTQNVSSATRVGKSYSQINQPENEKKDLIFIKSNWLI